MTKQKPIKRALLLSTLSLLMCVSMLIGSTFAWFTDSVTSANNKIVGGRLDLQLLLDTGNGYEDISDATESIFNMLSNKAQDNNGDTLWEPGKTQIAYLKLKNNGSLALKYTVALNITDVAKELYKVMQYTITPDAQYGEVTAWNAKEGKNVQLGIQTVTDTDVVMAPGDEHDFALSIHMSEKADNEYQGGEVDFDLTVLATQATVESDSFNNQYDANAEYPALVDQWDGTADFALFGLPRNAQPEDIDQVVLDQDTYTIQTAEELAAFAALVDEGNTFEGKTVKLETDINLDKKLFDPIGSYRKDKPFMGTFDGQGHTIANMSQNTWELDNGYYYSDLGLGLFGKVKNATIKNLTMDGAEISGESGMVGVVAAAAYGDCTFENITVTNSKGADYQYYAGGVVGWASGNHRYINCNIDASTIIATQWGDFDNSTGGVIGGAGGNAQIFMKDCEVACRIDAYNDVTSSYQWYAYRRCGMLIGNSGKTVEKEGTTYAAAPQLTCEDVTVIYGTWANYTYCEFAGTSWPYVRVQAGISNSAYSNPRYGHPTDAEGKEVVDDVHTHNPGEDHQILCVFDQLYGGGQGVYGNPVHEGVTVVYNNK